jgi:hypothetical protein
LFSEVIGFSVGPTHTDLKALHGNSMQIDDTVFFLILCCSTKLHMKKRFFYFLDIQHVAPLLMHCPHTRIAHGAEIDQLYLVEFSITSAVQMKPADFLDGFSLKQEFSKI